MKIVIVSNSHPTNDIRLYHKMAKSLAKIAEVYLYSTAGISNDQQNPYQVVVSSESRWYAIWQIFTEVKKIKADVVVCIEPLTLLLGFALRRRCNCKVVFDIHEFFADAFAERFPPMLRFVMKQFYLIGERWLYSQADLATAVNEQIVYQLCSKPIAAKTLILPNYPVLNVWDYNCEIPHTLHPICELDFDLVYIGGLTSDRGVFTLLESLHLLREDFPMLKALIVGKFFDPVVEQRFYDLITQLHLNSIVYYQSWLPPEKIGVLLKRAKIGLWIFNPSNRRMYNALPLKVLEYLSAGLPVVTIKSPLMSALIKKNHLGACVEYKPRQICDAIRKILLMPKEEYDALSEACLRITIEKYNWEALEPVLLSKISALVGEGS